MRAAKLLTLALCALLLLSSCMADINTNEAGDNSQADEVIISAIKDAGYSDDDSDTSHGDSAVKITCDETTVTIDGKGASAQNGIITISSAGEYILSGQLTGNVVIDADKDSDIHLIFDTVSITSKETAPVNIKKAKKVVLTLTKDSINTLNDSDSYVYDDESKEEPSAALFSKCDLSINGEGTLEINAKFNDGITSKDILRITGGTISVNSQDDGIIGRDAVMISGGAFNINAGGDGIKTTNDEDASLGYIKIDGGTFDITSAADGIQAETELITSGGAFNIQSGGGSANASYSDEGFNDGWGQWPMGAPQHRAAYTQSKSETAASSAKALKAGTLISISGGSFSIDSSDDSIHSNKNISISGGAIESSSGDDGIHADSAISISGGAITVSKSYEGLEACDITISGGEIKITAYDDGINGAGGNDGSSTDGRPGQNNFSSGTATFKITSGSLYVSATGDGIDINGSASVDGGTVYAFGPVDGGNGVLDYDTAFEVNGGTFIALGSSGMLQGFSGGSQASVTCTMPTAYAGDILSLENSDGEVLFSVEVEKQCTALIFSSEKLEVGKEYTLFSGEGDEKTEIGSYTQTQTTMGGSGGGNPGGGHPGGGPGGAPGKPMR